MTKIFEGFILISNPNYNSTEIENPNTVIIKDTKISIVFDYPIRIPYIVPFSNDNGFTILDIITHIRETYKKIYQIEEKTTKKKIIPIEKRGNLLNRNETNGKFGIWGHDIEDLAIEAIYYDEKKRIITLAIGS